MWTIDMFDAEDLKRIAELSKRGKFALWYDMETKHFGLDDEVANDAVWIMDVEQPEDGSFIAEVACSVLNDVSYQYAV